MWTNNLRAPVNLVVLSACQTALGKNMRGEGLIGLTRGFMHAGASGVAATLWSVDDHATAELMQKFYENMLREGQPPGAALREAQRFIRRQKGWHAPYYWAAVTLQGNYRQPLNPKPVISWRLALSGGLLILAGGGLFLFLYTRRKRHARPC